jgi:putative chitinase
VILTLDKLIGCMPYSGDRAPIYVECLNTAMHEFSIDSPLRQAMFLAQVAHESGSLRYTRELADGSAYEGRKDLGNTHEGDGKKYRGRGLLQVTGRANTLACLAALNRKLDDVEYLETPMGASRSAGWFWYVNGLSIPADQGLFWTVSKKINGGTNGLDDRIQHYTRCRKALGL